MITNRLIHGTCNVIKRFTQTLTSTLDPVQDMAMNEACILTDENDKAIGYASKRDCHKLKNGDLPLHRAFSVLLFNSKNELLLQKRSNKKITFPNVVSNTCCSHPLHDIDCERDETNALGVKLAAQRRLNIELGISPEEADINCMHYLTRIHYKSYGDGVWGEHEIDYILIMQRDVNLNPNPDEISELLYVSKSNLKDLSNDIRVTISPWFNYLIKSKLLDKWWDHLSNLNEITEQDKIYRLSII